MSDYPIEFSRLEKQIEELQADLDKAKEDNNKVICVFCGKIMQKPDDAEKVYDMMIEHMTSCDKHPIFKLARELDKLRKKHNKLIRRFSMSL